MAPITAGVTPAHAPAIGAALDNGKAQDAYWAPMFAGYDFSKRWIAQHKPDVVFLVYNDHATAFTLSIIVPRFARRCVRCGARRVTQGARSSSLRQTRAGARGPCRWCRDIPSWHVISRKR